MKNEHPILFSAPMVRAIIEGRKTQTRRIGKCQMDSATELGVEYMGHATRGKVTVATYRAFPGAGTARWGLCECPYGVPGDRLWVRETFAAPWGLDYKFPGGESGILYRADNPKKFPDDGTWKPSIFMPRKASRINLEIVSVSVERLCEISTADAGAEGCNEPNPDGYNHAGFQYKKLWENINGKGSWAKNPWVWVIEFKRIL